MDLKQSLLGGWLLCCICLAVSEDVQPKQTLSQFPVGPLTAQKRFDFKEWKKEKKGGGGSSGGWGSGGSGGGSSSGGGWGGGEQEGGPPGGFGMYPLWKFHKFDGFSLRPVPIQLDIGHGIPAPPPSIMPSYPSGWGQSSYGGTQQSSGYAPSGGYGQQASSSYAQQPASTSYGQQSSGYGQGQSDGGYQQQSSYQSGGGYTNLSPITMGYQAAPQPNYAPSSYSVNQQQYGGSSQPNYGPQTSSYSAPQSSGYSTPQSQSYAAPASSYSSQEMSYGASNSHPVTSSVPGGGFGGTSPKIPSYAAAFEGSSPFTGVSDLSMPMVSNQGGYMKRRFNTDIDDIPNNQQTTSSDGSEKDVQ